VSERVTLRAFHEADGLADWRVVGWGPQAQFRTGSFAAGVALVEAIGKLAEAIDHHPDVDLRPDGVTVRLMGGFEGLRDRDVELARRISEAARELGVPADPTAVQEVQVTLDALVAPPVMAFWRAVLGYQPLGDEDLVDPRRIGPSFWFQPMDAPRPQRNRFHIDVHVPPEQAETRIAAAVAAGGRVVSEHPPTWWTLADPEGNEVDVATWLGRE
jgi:4a-hydroxytetrahydrobiopterin dehydratase